MASLKSLLLASALAIPALPALAQEPQPVTVRYIYEWIHVRPGDGSGSNEPPFTGSVHFGDVSTRTPGFGSESELEAYIRNTQSGEVILDCNLNIAATPGHHDIVQVGPFAQQATGDAADLLEDPAATTGPGSNCVVAPSELTIDCPFQGLPITSAPGHHSFENKGTYHQPAPLDVATPANNTFSQRGEHGPIRCLLDIDGFELEMFGTLSFIKETRVGTFVPPQPFWQEPHDWVRVPEDLQRFDIPRP